MTRLMTGTLVAQFGQVNERIDGLRTEMGLRCDGVESRMDRLEGRMDRLETRVDNIDRDVQAISKRVFPE